MFKNYNRCYSFKRKVLLIIQLATATNILLASPVRTTPIIQHHSTFAIPASSSSGSSSSSSSNTYGYSVTTTSNGDNRNDGLLNVDNHSPCYYYCDYGGNDSSKKKDSKTQETHTAYLSRKRCASRVATTSEDCHDDRPTVEPVKVTDRNSNILNDNNGRITVQVGGLESRILSLDDGRSIFKPTKQSEISFYEFIFNTRHPLSKVIPMYKGTAVLNMDSSGNSLSSASTITVTNGIILENLLYGIKEPCVLDIKVGNRTWSVGASQQKIDSQTRKIRSTTLGSMNLRIDGMKVENSQSQTSMLVGKTFGRGLTEETFQTGLGKFFTTTNKLTNKRTIRQEQQTQKHDDILVDGTSLVDRRVIFDIIKQLDDIYIVMQGITDLRLYSSSLLIVFDGSLAWDSLAIDRLLSLSSQSTLLAKVVIIDFANAYIDDSPTGLGRHVDFMNGIENLRRVLLNIVG